MNELNLHALGAHVVAWHNRHPLARRITTAQLHSVGYVALPFLAGASAPGDAASDAASDAAGDSPGVAPGVAPGDAPGDAHDAATVPAADASGGPTLRERAMARAHGTETAPAPAAAPASADAPGAGAPLAPTGAARAAAFSEDFIAPLAPARVARWAAVHGVALATPPADAPVRRISTDGAADVARVKLLWVLTAQVQVGRSRTRVLVGAGSAPSVLGRRLLSRTRIAGLAALGSLLLAGAVALHGAGTGAPAVGGVGTGATASAAASAASAVSAAVGSAASTAAVSASAVSAAAVSSAATPASAALAPSPSPSASATAAAPVARVAEPARPVDVEPTLGRVSLPPIGPRADERRKAAEQAIEAQVASSRAMAAAAAAAAEAAASNAFAVSTRLLRTRTESEQIAAAMRALLVTAGMPQMHVEAMPAGEDWRVVGWPYANRAQAEKARLLLAARGMKVEVIGF